MDESRITLEDLTSVRKRLEIEVPAGAVQAELDRAFARLRQQARLPGFRPGRVPRLMLDKMFGADVRREVLGRLVEESLRSAVESRGLDIVGTPDIDADGLTPGEALRYRATLEVRPVIDVGDLDGIEVKRPAAVVSDDEVESVLGSLQESVAQLRPVEDRTSVQDGDVVTVDLVTRLDGGEPVRREDVFLEAGKGSFPQALERQLVGHERGATLTPRVPYPEDHPNRGLAGRVAEFEVAIKDIRVKELPRLDDDFARDHGRCASLVELRDKVRADLEQRAAGRADDAVRDAVLEQALSRHSFDVPPSLVKRRAEAMVASLEVKLPPGADQGRAMEELLEQVRPRAEQQVRAELLLDAIGERDEVKVSDTDVAAEIEAMATREREVGDRIRSLYGRPEARVVLGAKLRRERVLDALVARANVVPQ